MFMPSDLFEVEEHEKLDDLRKLFARVKPADQEIIKKLFNLKF
jgi:hypothetical protein